MRRINPYSHIPFLHTRLMNFLTKDSFSHRMRRTIGNEIDAILDSEDYEGFGLGRVFYEMGNYPAVFPVESLYIWISKSGGITLEFLENADGSFLDDERKLIPATPIPSLTGVEQMAAFGLWFIDCEMNICGPATEEDYNDDRINPNGWREADVINHKAECLLNAYRALSYAERIIGGASLSDEERNKVTQFDFSAIGKEGAKKRHAQMKALREWALDLYRAGDWSSANQAAHELKNKVIEYGRTINANLKPSNAQRTIAEWFRDCV